jgi:hypothetical protein
MPIQNLLPPLLLGEFLWGLPSSCFEVAMTWRSKDLFPIVKRDGFPSWSWAGWQGFAHPVQFRPNEPTFIAAEFGYRDGAKLTWYHTNQSGDLEIGLPTNNILSSKHLIFWTSSAMLQIGRDLRRHRQRIAVGPFGEQEWVGLLHAHAEFAIKQRGESYSSVRMGTIRLDPQWRADKPDEMEFIIIATDSNGSFLVMLIEWKEGVAYRVQMSSDPISHSAWPLYSRRKMIILG